MLDGRVVEHQVPDRQRQSSINGQVTERPGPLAGERHRLLDEDVLSGAQRLLGELGVGYRRGRDDDSLDAVIGEERRRISGERNAGHAARASGASVFRGIADEPQVSSRVTGEGANMIDAPVAATEDADPYRLISDGRHRR